MLIHTNKEDYQITDGCQRLLIVRYQFLKWWMDRGKEEWLHFKNFTLTQALYTSTVGY